jgi:predicted RNA-binding protein Jag
MGRMTKLFIGLVVITVLVFVLYRQFADWHREEVQEAVQQERQNWQVKTEDLERKVSELEQELPAEAGSVEPRDKVTEALGEAPRAETTPSGEKPAASTTVPKAGLSVEEQVTAFFRYLDSRAYVKDRHLEEGSYAQFRQAVALLGQSPPVLTGETDDLYRLLANFAHLYRVLGKQRLAVAQDVLGNESEVIESVMRTFFDWFTQETTTLPGRPSELVQYQYAAYLLHTIGGRGYMGRRESRLRTLTYYYCVRILDRANDRKLNSIGIDIRPYILSAIQDIRDQRRLSFRRTYLVELNRLALKYKVS